MIRIGIAVTAATMAVLVIGYFRSRRYRPFPAHGWLGIAALGASRMAHAARRRTDCDIFYADCLERIHPDRRCGSACAHQPFAVERCADRSGAHGAAFDSSVAGIRGLQSAAAKLDVHRRAVGLDGAVAWLWLVVCYYHAGDFRNCRSGGGAVAAVAGQTLENFRRRRKMRSLSLGVVLPDCSVGGAAKTSPLICFFRYGSVSFCCSIR